MCESSSYFASLQAVNARLQSAGKTPVKVRIAPEDLADEDILEMVSAGLVPATVVDDHVAKFWEQIFTDLVLCPDATLRSGGERGWMIRKGNPLLKGSSTPFSRTTRKARCSATCCGKRT